MLTNAMFAGVLLTLGLCTVETFGRQCKGGRGGSNCKEQQPAVRVANTGKTDANKTRVAKNERKKEPPAPTTPATGRPPRERKPEPAKTVKKESPKSGRFSVLLAQGGDDLSVKITLTQVTTRRQKSTWNLSHNTVLTGIPPGDYELKVEQQNYETYQRQLTIKGGENAPHEVNRKLLDGFLTVSSNVRGASVCWVSVNGGGALRCATRENEELRLAPDVYTLTISKDGYETISKPVRIDPNRHYSETVALVQRVVVAPPPVPATKPTPAKPVVVVVTPPVVNKKVTAVYPPFARQTKAQGEVIVSVDINEAGTVIRAYAASGHELLRNAAKEAAQKWTFFPARQGNAPVPYYGFQIKFNFLPPN